MTYTDENGEKLKDLIPLKATTNHLAHGSRCRYPRQKKAHSEYGWPHIKKIFSDFGVDISRDHT